MGICINTKYKEEKVIEAKPIPISIYKIISSQLELRVCKIY